MQLLGLFIILLARVSVHNGHQFDAYQLTCTGYAASSDFSGDLNEPANVWQKI